MQMNSLFSKLGKVLPWGLAVLFAAMCGILLYGSINQAVTFDHRDQECVLFQKQRDMLWSVAASMAKGATKAQIVQLIEQRNEVYFFKGANQVIAGQVSFVFDNDALARIEICGGLEACQ